ncbi:NADP-dependent oxidoreductase domain-containing protein [Lipomyces orientalis]|uniref:NADP-dependent oxidoreductase domain-containing protein n=1 Tax=Lipomyces orientalis TaxID=1233043 RepID=A0ACC3TI66_9ASCO
MEATQIAERYNLTAPVVERSQHHAFHRERFEVEYSPICEQFKYGATIWSPLASGLLAGKYNNGIPQDSRFATNPAFFKSALNVCRTKEAMRRSRRPKVDQDRGETWLQVATSSNSRLHWPRRMRQSAPSSLEPRKSSRWHDNCGALKLIEMLTSEMMEEINTPKPAPTYGRNR